MIHVLLFCFALSYSFNHHSDSLSRHYSPSEDEKTEAWIAELEF